MLQKNVSNANCVTEKGHTEINNQIKLINKPFHSEKKENRLNIHFTHLTFFYTCENNQSSSLRKISMAQSTAFIL